MHDKYREAFANIKATNAFKNQIINKLQEASRDNLMIDTFENDNGNDREEIREYRKKNFNRTMILFSKKGWRVATFIVAFIVLSGSIVYAMEVIKLKKLNQNYVKMDDEKGILITQTYSMDFVDTDEKVDGEKLLQESESNNIIKSIGYDYPDVETAIEQENLMVVLPNMESLEWTQEKFLVSKMLEEIIYTNLDIWYKDGNETEIYYSVQRIEFPQKIDTTYGFGIQYGPENAENMREYTSKKEVTFVLFDSTHNQKTYTNVALGIKESISENYYYFISFSGMEEKKILKVLDTLDFSIYQKE